MRAPGFTAKTFLRSIVSSLWPELSAGRGTSRSYQESGDGSRWQGAATLSYELDLFGRHRSQTAAAKSREEASGHDRDALRLVVMTDAASLYSRLLAFNDRSAIAEQNLASAEEVLRIIEARKPLSCGRHRLRNTPRDPAQSLPGSGRRGRRRARGARGCAAAAQSARRSGLRRRP